MGRRNWVIVGVATTALALVISGCGKGNVATDNPQPGIGHNDINAQDPSTLKQGGDLHWPIEEYPAQFNMLEADATNGDIPPVVESVMPTPVWEQPDGSFVPDPYYVKSFTLTSKDPQTVTFELNPQAKWSNGKPITWADYQSQWKAVNGKNPAFKVLSTAGYANVASIKRGKNDDEFTETFNPKFADWASLFQVLYPQSATSNPAQFNSGWKTQPLVTGGPFKIGQLDTTGKNVIVVPDPNWWGPKPKLDKIIFHDYADNPDTAKMVQNHDLDFAGTQANIDLYKQFKAMPGVTIRRANLNNFYSLVLNGKSSSILSDPKLRTAIIKGVNKDAIAQAEVGQITPGAKSFGNHIYVPGFDGYQDNSSGYGYNPDDAKKDLDALGWKTNGQYRQKNGKTLTVNFLIPGSTPVSADIARLVQNQLSQIGVQIKINTVDSDSFFDQYVTPGDFDITVYSFMTSGSPITDAISNFTLGPGSQNFGQIGSKQINSELQQVGQELDPAKQKQILNDIDKQEWQLGYGVPLMQRPSVVACRNGLANMGDTGVASIDYTKIGWQK